MFTIQHRKSLNALMFVYFVLSDTGVTINTYKVIYNLIDDVKAAMEGKLRQVEEKIPIGTATVSVIF